jgi:hypothetical protein
LVNNDRLLSWKVPVLDTHTNKVTWEEINEEFASSSIKREYTIGIKLF